MKHFLKTLKIGSICLMTIVFLAACTEEASDDSAEITEQNNEDAMEINQDEAADNNGGNQDTSENSSDPDAYKHDIGNLKVWIGGEVIVEEDKIIINGESNLLPGTTIRSSGTTGALTDWGQQSFSESASIREDGSFTFEFPDKEYIEITLSASRNSGDRLIEHYGKYFEKATGPQVYKTNKSGEYQIRQEIIVFDHIERPFTIPIEAPVWSMSDDYGDTNIWMEIEATTDHRYLYIHGRSNLVEGTSIEGELLNSKGRRFGFLNVRGTTVNPDGSFLLKMGYRRISEGMQYRVRFEPNGRWDNVTEAYGEEGELLEGDLVYVREDGRKYIEKIVTLDAPSLNPPEEVDMTVADEEIKMQVPDDLLFDFDKSKLKSDAKQTLDGIISELESLPSGTVIHINGHTDNQGNPDYNLELSEERAVSVYDYLTNNGDLSHLLIEKKGYGEAKPIDTNEEEDGRARNRRVEIVINPNES